jgi:molybdopterin molybdotransferase
LLFGLPGNPSAVLTCFYEYIVPAIEKMSGHPGPSKRVIQKTLTEGFTKKAGLTYFLKGKVAGKEVAPLHAQESYQMSSFALADCLIVLEEDKTEYLKGEMVAVHLF